MKGGQPLDKKDLFDVNQLSINQLIVRGDENDKNFVMKFSYPRVMLSNVLLDRKKFAGCMANFSKGTE